MINFYYYLLYRLYSFYSKETHDELYKSISVTILSSLIVFLPIINIYFYFGYLDFIRVFNVYWYMGSFVCFNIVNYVLFVKRRHFLDINSSRSVLKDIMLFVLVFISILMFVVVSNLNREKMGL